MKMLIRVFFIVLAVFMISVAFGVFCSATTYSGTCGADGDNLTWTIDTESGVLEISGTGAMMDYTGKDMPWYPYRNSVKTVRINEGVTTVGNYAFRGYDKRFRNLKEVELADSITDIGSYSFEYIEISSIELPENLLNIGASAFFSCKELEKISLPESLLKIEENAFSECIKITNVKLPTSIKEISGSAFRNCSSLTAFSIDENNESFSVVDGMVLNKNKDTLILIPSGKINIVIPDSVKSFSKDVFCYDDIIKSVTVPEGITSIADDAFKGCSNLRSIYLPDSLTKIGARAFYDCFSLTSIYIPEGISVIETNVFAYTALKKVIIPDSVVKIEYSAFYGCDDLQELHFGKNVKEIEADAFTYLYFGGSSYRQVIGVDSIYYNGTLEDWCSIKLGSSDVSLGVLPPGPCAKKLYINGELLENLVIPDGVTTISARRFYGIECIKTISLPSTLKEIGANAFYGVNPEKVFYSGSVADWCSLFLYGNKIGTVRGGNPVKSSTDFYIDGKLIRDIKITSDVTKIGRMTFYDNDKIRTVYIPKSVKDVLGYAFGGCDNLTDVYYEGTQEEWNAIYKESSNDSLTKAVIHFNSDSDDFGYNIKFYADMPSLTIKEGCEVSAGIQLLHHGKVVESDTEFTIVSATPDILSIEDLSAEGGTVTFTLKAGKPGVAKITINEGTSGIVRTAEFEVVTGNLIFNSQYLPNYYEKDNAYNCYSSGLYIADFKSALVDDDTYRVTFNAYNSLSVMGVVCVYDAEGEIYKVYPIDRFDGNMATSIKDTFLNGYDLIDDIVWGDFATFKSELLTTETPLEIDVPAGGYIEITNNPLQNKYIAALNYVGFIFDFAGSVSDFISFYTEYGTVTEKIGAEILFTLMEKEPELLEEFFKELSKSTIKEISISNIDDFIIGKAQNGLEILNKSGLDIISIVNKVAPDAISNVGQSLFEGATGSIGFCMKNMFAFSKFVSTTCWFLDLIKDRVEDSIKIWTFDSDGNFCDNGVKGNNIENTVDIAESNFVMRSVIITDGEEDGIDFGKIFNKKIAENYVVRDIYFECNGKITQPGQKIQVSIPVPSGYDPDLCSVYWVKGDGTTEKMSATYENGYMKFVTNHFSYYVLVEEHNHSYAVTESVKASCTSQGYTTYTCACGDSYIADYVMENGHDFNGDNVCRVCSYKDTSRCDCLCHTKNVFLLFIWKIANFFSKLFGINPLCGCGVKHY